VGWGGQAGLGQGGLVEAGLSWVVVGGLLGIGGWGAVMLGALAGWFFVVFYHVKSLFLLSLSNRLLYFIELVLLL
jgi:hypothetical protein